MDKQELVEKISKWVAAQLDEIGDEISSIVSGMAAETKSSAGDKFETSREMMNQERARLEDRLEALKKSLHQIDSMKMIKDPRQVEFGALVDCQGTYFLFGVSLGKFIHEDQEIFLLSLNSPIGKAFKGKKEKEQIQFLSKHYFIHHIS